MAVVEGVRTTLVTGSADYGVSREGDLAYRVGAAGRADEFLLAWIDRGGGLETLPFTARNVDGAVVSPDGSRIAAEVTGEGTDVWLFEVERGGE
ncbi:MAG: hypothetical protein GWN71_33290, partial [Gammaproteobacteria bacterium]|nr:hypothetical protein [Gammaproteobacteria bacterium]